jgi:hypothetical protein
MGKRGKTPNPLAPPAGPVRARRAKPVRVANPLHLSLDGPRNPVLGPGGPGETGATAGVVKVNGQWRIRMARRCPHPECWGRGRGGTKQLRRKRPRGFFCYGKTRTHPENATIREQETRRFRIITYFYTGSTQTADFSRIPG